MCLLAVGAIVIVGVVLIVCDEVFWRDGRQIRRFITTGALEKWPANAGQPQLETFRVWYRKPESNSLAHNMGWVDYLNLDNKSVLPPVWLAEVECVTRTKTEVRWFLHHPEWILVSFNPNHGHARVRNRRGQTVKIRVLLTGDQVGALATEVIRYVEEESAVAA